VGYTHYWTFKRSALSPEELGIRYQRAVEEIRHLLKRLTRDIVISGADGTGHPILNNEKVCFNGDTFQDLDHETFFVPLIKETDGFSRDSDWDFCKTSRKPYDLLVCVSLIAFSRALPGVFTLT